MVWSTKTKKSTKFVWIIGFIVVIIILGLFLYSKNSSSALVETKFTKSTNETVLHIPGTEWYAKLNLSGYQGSWAPSEEYPTRFLAVEKKPLRVSIFAEKIKEVDSVQKCRDFNKVYVQEFLDDMVNLSKGKATFSSLTEKERPGQYLLEYSYQLQTGSKKTVNVNYYDYYDGYCFDFHVSGTSEEDTTQKIYELLDTIVLVKP